MIELTDNPDISTNDYVVARNMAETLHREYPGHVWGVTCDGDKGIATIRNMALSARYGFILKLSDLFGDTHMRCVVRAGGEILERFGQRRGIIRPESIQALPTLPDGFPVFDPGSAKGKVSNVVKERWDQARGVVPRPVPKLIVETGWNSKRP